MGDLPFQTAPCEAPPFREFYVTGGTLRPDAACYVERSADRDLREGLLHGEFCYVLTSRQMGKSSLMVRTVRRLRQEQVAVAVLDLTAIGQNLSLDQWYEGLLSRLGQQLDLEDELVAFSGSHPEWGPLQRWVTAIEQVVLHKVPGKVVIFIDEIDIVRSLPFPTDEFFAAIREFYNRRSREPAFARLSFGLLGVAAPNDLICDTRMTPFNIGRRIELNDFTAAEASPLAQGLGADPSVATSLLSRVLYWTGGHPYLTQRLCRALAEALRPPEPYGDSPAEAVPPLLPTAANVDRLAAQLFLSRRARDQDDNLIFVRERILRSEADVAGLLYLYRRIHQGRRVAEDETNPLVSVLRLSGVVRSVEGVLHVRNRIYKAVFDPAWVHTNMPEAEVRRQRKAGRRGMLTGFAIAVPLLIASFILWPVTIHYIQTRLARDTAKHLLSAYRHIQAYQDTFVTTNELVLGGTVVSVTGSGSLIFEEPDQVNLALKSDFTSPPTELHFLRNGRRRWVWVPALNQYEGFQGPGGSAPPPSSEPWFGGPRQHAPFDLPPPLDQQLGPLRILPLYRLLLGGPELDHFLNNARNFRFGGISSIDGEPVRIITWEQDASSFLRSLGPPDSMTNQSQIPVTAWVNSTNNLILRIRMVLSPWAAQLLGRPGALPATGLTITETHRFIHTFEEKPPMNPRRFEPPPDAERVRRLALPPIELLSLAAAQRQFSKLIPPRMRQATPDLIDLDEYYNAALGQTWHPGAPSNSLDIVAGLLEFEGVVFDVRGIVQLAGGDLARAGAQYPQQIRGIKIGQTCRQLHFLHATGWASADGTRVGAYVVHYRNGVEQPIPIVYGEDVRDWNSGADPSSTLTRASVVWRSQNKANYVVRLFKSTWVNPFPEEGIVSIDFLSSMAESAPFVIAITAEH